MAGFMDGIAFDELGRPVRDLAILLDLIEKPFGERVAPFAVVRKKSGLRKYEPRVGKAVVLRVTAHEPFKIFQVPVGRLRVEQRSVFEGHIGEFSGLNTRKTCRRRQYASVTVERDLQLALRRADGSSATVYLSNAYRDYTGVPAHFDELVRLHAALFMQPPTASNPDRTRIVAVIKDRAWRREIEPVFAAKGDTLLAEDFNKELKVVYAEDSDARMRYLGARDDIGNRKALRALAHLKRVLPKLEMREVEACCRSFPPAGTTRRACRCSTTSGPASDQV